MKEIQDLILPDDMKYAESHEWIKKNNDIVKIGINDYAQDQLGEIVFVELPEVGDSFSKGDEFSNVESVKAVSEIYIPVSGEIISVNEKLEDAPELINDSCYEDGWIAEVKLSNPSEFDALLNKEAYLETIKG